MKTLLLLLVLAPIAAGAQPVSQRGFVESGTTLFAQGAPTDATRAIADVRVREEVFYKPARWVQFAAGVDARVNSHDEVEDDWRVDFADRTLRRPRLSVRRLTATVTRGRFTIDAGKQFVRWGQTDIVTPTDRLAPRDFLNVIDSEFLAITAVRGVVQAGAETFEAVWSPRFTPSRTPLLDSRWSGIPPAATLIAIVDGGAVVPSGSQVGVRWSHVGAGMEFALSYYDGFNHLPTFVSTVQSAPPATAITRRYSSIRTYGVDTAVPTRWFTLKAEAAYFTTTSAPFEADEADDYVSYVIQLERQSGEWLLVGGYAGEAASGPTTSVTFAPDRGFSRALVARASYTVDPTRSVAVEGAVRQNGQGMFTRGEYSQAYRQHWRVTAAGVLIRGEGGDFLGQYRHNSNVKLTLRYNF